MIKQKFFEGEIIQFKNRNFTIISVSKVFENTNPRKKDAEWVIYDNRTKLINYFIVAKSGKSYLSFLQDRNSYKKIVTEHQMYAGLHMDLPKNKKFKTLSLL